MKQAFVQAFDIWEKDFRENPTEYLTPEQVAALESMPLAEARATCFIAFLDKLAGGKPWAEIGAVS